MDKGNIRMGWAGNCLLALYEFTAFLNVLKNRLTLNRREVVTETYLHAVKSNMTL